MPRPRKDILQIDPPDGAAPFHVGVSGADRNRLILEQSFRLFNQSGRRLTRNGAPKRGERVVVMGAESIIPGGEGEARGFGARDVFRAAIRFLRHGRRGPLSYSCLQVSLYGFPPGRPLTIHDDSNYESTKLLQPLLE